MVFMQPDKSAYKVHRGYAVGVELRRIAVKLLR
jgi:hypothetical protein